MGKHYTEKAAKLVHEWKRDFGDPFTDASEGELIRRIASALVAANDDPMLRVQRDGE